MTETMEHFVCGLIAGLVCNGVLDEADGSYSFANGTLSIREYDSSLSHSWDWDTMQYDVEANS